MTARLISARVRRAMRAVPFLCLLAAAAGSADAHPHGGGIASAHPYNGLEIKIKISPEEVLFDTAMSVETIDRLVGADWRMVAGEKRPFVDVLEEQRIRERLTAHFAEQGFVLVDGLRVKPVLKSWKVSREYNTGERGGLSYIIPDFYAVFSYPCKSPPASVTARWTVYPVNAPLPFVEGEDKDGLAVELSAGEKVRLIVFSAAEPEFTWRAEEPGAGPLVADMPARGATVGVPIVSAVIVAAWAVALVVVRFAARPGRRLRFAGVATVLSLVSAPLCAGMMKARVPWPWGEAGPSVDETKAKDIFRSLHANIYRAFDYATESDIYDSLAQSLDGRLLEDVYKQVYESLVMQSAGGAVSRIQSVRLLDNAFEPVSGGEGGAFAVRCGWQVVGAVYHSGHGHFRMNQYQARYTVAPRGGVWKITDCEVLEYFRVEPDETANPPAAPAAGGGGASRPGN